MIKEIFNNLISNENMRIFKDSVVFATLYLISVYVYTGFITFVEYGKDLNPVLSWVMTFSFLLGFLVLGGGILLYGWKTVLWAPLLLAYVPLFDKSIEWIFTASLILALAVLIFELLKILKTKFRRKKNG